MANDPQARRDEEEDRRWQAEMHDEFLQRTGCDLPEHLTEDSLDDLLWESFFRNYLRPIWLAHASQKTAGATAR